MTENEFTQLWLAINKPVVNILLVKDQIRRCSGNSEMLKFMDIIEQESFKIISYLKKLRYEKLPISDVEE